MFVMMHLIAQTCDIAPKNDPLTNAVNDYFDWLSVMGGILGCVFTFQYFTIQPMRDLLVS